MTDPHTDPFSSNDQKFESFESENELSSDTQKAEPLAHQKPEGEPDQMDKLIASTRKSIKRKFRRQKELISKGQWFEACLYSVIFFIAGFAPMGPVYIYLLKDFVEEEDNFLSHDLYLAIFLIAIFIICSIFAFLKIISSIRFSKLRAMAFITGSLLILSLVISNFSFADTGYIKGRHEDKISWGEESLFETNSPENIVYKKNREAVESSLKLFNRPLKIGVAMPISWDNGFYNAKEVVSGVAIAQKDWNDNPAHNNEKFSIVLADDGFSNNEFSNAEFKSELDAAEAIADRITHSNPDLLGVIGHFSSDATYATQGIYSSEKIVLISPTSTAKRCANNSNPDFDPENIKTLESVLESGADCLQFNNYVFRTALTDDMAVDVLLEELSARNIKRIIVISESDNLYSSLYKKSFLEKGIDKISNLDPENQCSIEELNLNEEDCFALINKENPDALFLVPSTKNNVWVEKVIEFNRNEQDPSGKRKYQILGADSMYQAGFIRVNGKERPETEGMLIPISWHRKININEKCSNDDQELECRAVDILYTSKKVDKNGNFSSSGINWRTAMAYDAAQILFKATANAKDKCFWEKHLGLRARCIKSKLQETLAETGFGNENGEKTSGQVIEFADGDRKSANRVIIQAKEGNFERI